jgi:hypothetical protein
MRIAGPATEETWVADTDGHPVLVLTAEPSASLAVLPMPDELGRHLGMSVRIDSTPVICVSKASSAGKPSVPGDRQRWTIAHELAHLGLHSHLGSPRPRGTPSG